VPVAVNSVDEASGESVAEGAPAPAIPAGPSGARKPRGKGHAPQFNMAVVGTVGVLITAGLSLGAY